MIVSNKINTIVKTVIEAIVGVSILAALAATDLTGSLIGNGSSLGSFGPATVVFLGLLFGLGAFILAIYALMTIVKMLKV